MSGLAYRIIAPMKGSFKLLPRSLVGRGAARWAARWFYKHFNLNTMLYRQPQNMITWLFIPKNYSFARNWVIRRYTQLVRLEYRDTDASRAERVAQEMGEQVRNWLLKENQRKIRMIGPVPCFFARMGGAYRWQIVLSGNDPSRIFRG